MLFWTGNYLLVCLALLGLASAISVPRQHETLSNAQRVARGLTPNKPTRLYDPTRVRPARQLGSQGVSLNNAQQVAVGGGTTTTGPFSKRDTLQFLMVTTSGSLSTTSVQSEGSYFIVPSAGGSLQWVPQVSSGSFSANMPYSMYLVGSPSSGAASLQFSSTALVGANLVQFGQAAFAGGFAPQFGGSSLLWLMSPTTGMMYMSTSIVAGLEAMALQAVIAGQVPSISQAVAALSAALNPPPPHPMRLYAATQDGSKVGWMGCLAATGGACQQIYVGNPGDPGMTFYFPNSGTTLAQPILNQMNGIYTVIGSNEMSQSALLYSKLGTSLSVPTAVGFLLPASGFGVVVPDVTGNGDIFTFANGLVYICPGGSCTDVNAAPICVEAVPPGGQPSACAAYWKSQPPILTSAMAAQLYVVQVSAPSAGTAPVSGWLVPGELSLSLSPTRANAGTFMFPTLGTTAAPVYATINGKTELATWYIGNNYATQAGFAPIGSATSTAITNWMYIPQIANSVVSVLQESIVPESGDYRWYFHWFYSASSNLVKPYPDLATAQRVDPSNVQVCIESVAPGAQAGLACQPSVQYSFPTCSTSLRPGSVHYARMTGYNTGNAFAGPSASSETSCMSSCEAINLSRPGSCTGASYFPATGPAAAHNCGLRDTSTTTSSWFANSPSTTSGAETFLIGQCSDFANGYMNIPADMLATCCND